MWIVECQMTYCWNRWCLE